MALTLAGLEIEKKQAATGVLRVFKQPGILERLERERWVYRPPVGVNGRTYESRNHEN
ncbi:hypothetical protein [Escherichia albertii]|uniref:hypothetical protein n=1 Tax=Escherichia albertii TaxID=208962 RepID=UPI002119F7E8|nr:hypothetical protein [Escherichia albertii]UUK80770.1 hypothetical protein NIZ23_22880 [Escherichia albertii]